jgi:hypothetical protein
MVVVCFVKGKQLQKLMRRNRASAFMVRTAAAAADVAGRKPSRGGGVYNGSFGSLFLGAEAVEIVVVAGHGGTAFVCSTAFPSFVVRSGSPNPTGVGMMRGVVWWEGGKGPDFFARSPFSFKSESSHNTFMAEQFL